ncbi:hypothetical protein HPULCUR_009044 [Helicostylum pulchrum]|uniref:Uncharacterized protein n=1 Tax=Helicostylum pulchrum TaxID=562976 RepID=A0ABP9Y9C1_9FUNG
MRKFSNLQSLVILANGREPEVSSPTLIRFAHYVISTPKFEFNILVRKEDLMILSDKAGAHLNFVQNTDGNEVNHIRFLSETNRLLRSLKVDVFFMIPGTKGETSKSIDRLFDILQLCPLLKECTLNHAASLLASHRKSKYPSLKKMSIPGVEYSIISLGILHYLPLNLPNLCEFPLGFNHTYDKNTNPIVIKMPHLLLDSLTWYDNSRVNCDIDVEEVYIKLKTERGLRYYSGSIYELILVDESRYLLAAQNT